MVLERKEYQCSCGASIVQTKQQRSFQVYTQLIKLPTCETCVDIIKKKRAEGVRKHQRNQRSLREQSLARARKRMRHVVHIM